MKAELQEIARVDLSRYEPNAQLETLAQSYVRGGNYDLQITRTPNPVYYINEADKHIDLILSGQIRTSEKSGLNSIVIVVMNNKESNQAILELPVSTSRDPTGTWVFNMQHSLNLDYGLYYYLLETGEGELLKGGQFRVDLVR
jgi:hypothetical protein